MHFNIEMLVYYLYTKTKFIFLAISLKTKISEVLHGEGNSHHGMCMASV